MKQGGKMTALHFSKALGNNKKNIIDPNLAADCYR